MRFDAVDGARNQIEWQGAVDVATFGIDGKGHAHHLGCHFARLLAFGQVTPAQAGQIFDEVMCGRPGFPVGLDQLVKGG